MTLHVYEDLEQRSDEWHKLRLGIVTASTIGRLIKVSPPGPQHYICPECDAAVGEPCTSKTRKAGESGAPIKTMHNGRTIVATNHADEAPPILTVADNDTSQAMLLALAAERISGHAEPSMTNFAMLRGVEDEPFARDAYAEWAGVEVDEVGFMVREEGPVRVGFSPDGLIGDKGCLEIKSRTQGRQLATILDDQPPTENLAQMHAGMWVSDRDWCDYVSYRDGMHLYPKRVHRDPKWDAVVLAAAEHAERVITGLVALYERRTKGLPHIEKRPDLDDII